MADPKIVIMTGAFSGFGNVTAGIATAHGRLDAIVRVVDRPIGRRPFRLHGRLGRHRIRSEFYNRIGTAELPPQLANI
jgi:hypothetical protein